MFVKQKDGSQRIIFDNLKNIEDTLPSGVYALKVEKIESWMGTQVNFYLTKTDKYVGKSFIKAGIYKTIDDLITIHLSDAMMKAKKLLKMPNKLGLWFNGLPGTGKSFTAGLVGQRIVDKKGGICIITTDANGENAKMVIEHIRTFTDKPIVWVFDEFEKKVKSSDSVLLSLLDGVDSPENIMFIATSNSTNNIPNFILDRPGRFEQVIEFKIEDPVVLNNIILSILPDDYKNETLIRNINTSVQKSKNKTVDKIVLIIRDHLSKYIYLQSRNSSS